MRKVIDVKWLNKYPILWCTTCDAYILSCPDCDATTCNSFEHECVNAAEHDAVMSTWNKGRNQIECHITFQQWHTQLTLQFIEEQLIKSWKNGKMGVDWQDVVQSGRYNEIVAENIPSLKAVINGTAIPKKILYIDMDGVLVDFDSAIAQLPDAVRKSHEGKLDEVRGIFSMMQPMQGAIEAFHRLCAKYDVYILSTASWGNPSAWSDKLNWVKKYLGNNAHKRLILTHNKHLNIGDYLIDDRLANGADEFQGELIQFGTPNSPDWESILVRLGA